MCFVRDEEDETVLRVNQVNASYPCEVRAMYKEGLLVTQKLDLQLLGRSALNFVLLQELPLA